MNSWLEMPSDATREHQKIKIFLGGMPPNPPRKATGLRRFDLYGKNISAFSDTPSKQH